MDECHIASICLLRAPCGVDGMTERLYGYRIEVAFSFRYLFFLFLFVKRGICEAFWAFVCEIAI